MNQLFLGIYLYIYNNKLCVMHIQMTFFIVSYQKYIWKLLSNETMLKAIIWCVHSLRKSSSYGRDFHKCFNVVVNRKFDITYIIIHMFVMPINGLKCKWYIERQKNKMLNKQNLTKNIKSKSNKMNKKRNNFLLYRGETFIHQREMNFYPP